ncbi:MAG TPA: hypothetical protein VIK39_19585 [Candidatus Angelobacter sp.]
MPLARIFTRNPERTADLSSQLKQQGYSVEVAHPDQANLAPADLEIEFEICERADVLDRAADLANELGADVAVAPGILQMAAKPVAKPIAAQLVAAEPAAPKPVFQAPVAPEPVTENVMELKSRAIVEPDPERDFEAAFAPVIEMEMPAIEMPEKVQASAEGIDLPVLGHEPMAPVAFLEESVAAAPIATASMAERYPETPIAERYPAAPAVISEPARAADPMPYLAQLTPFSIPASRASETIKEQKQPIAVPSVRPPQAQVHGKKVLDDGARIAAHTWAGALALAASTTASVRDHFEEYKKRAQVRSAEARAAHAARLLDLEQRRAEAHQRAAELEAAREQATARLIELVRQRGPGLPPERVSHETMRDQRKVEQAIPAQSQSLESRSLESQHLERESFFERPPVQDRKREVPPVWASATAAKLRRPAMTATPIKLWRSINPPLRAVLTGAAAVSALFIMGIALGLFHSRPQMASTPNRSSNGVSVQTGGVTLPAVPAKLQAAQPVAGTPQAKPLPGNSTQAQSAATKPSPRVRQTNLVAQQSEKQIGDDVVIRHYSRPVPTQKPKQAAQQAGLKHFSDLEN